MIRGLASLLPAREHGKLRVYLACVVAGTVLRAAACVALVPLLRELFGEQPSDAWPWVAVLTACTVAGWVVDLTAARRGFAVGRVLMHSVLDRLLDRLQAVPLEWFTTGHTTAAQRTFTGVGQELFSAMSNLVTPVVTATLLPYVLGVLLLPISWPVGLVALACAPLLQLARWGSTRLLRSADEHFTTATEAVDQRVVEFARTQPVLRAAGRAGTEGSALDHALDGQQRATVRLLGWAIPGQILFTIAWQVALVLLAVTAVSQWSSDALTVAETIGVFVVIVRYLEPFTEVADVAPAIESLRGTIRRTSSLLAAPVLPVPDAPATVPRAAGAAPAIELRDVTFTHGAGGEEGDGARADAPDAAGPATLDGVGFVVAPGTTTAIVGPSGAGKTTILTLVARFSDVDRGAVLVGGVPVDRLDPADLLALLGVVFQDVYLFDGTIRENVRHGRPGATDAEVGAVAAVARVDEIVARLPQGWDTRVGEGGAALSGGERQRVSIARALLKDAPVLLLDEATSAIDPENEAAILDALGAGDRTRTVLVVAHRSSTIERADQVVFLDEGRVLEVGSPRELAAAGGPFARYWGDRAASEGWTLGQPGERAPATGNGS